MPYRVGEILVPSETEGELSHHHQEPAEQVEQPITPSQAIKWIGFAAGISSTLVTLVWFIATMKSDQALMKQQLDTHITEIKELRGRVDTSDKAFQDMRLDLARALVVLNSIDKRLSEKDARDSKP